MPFFGSHTNDSDDEKDDAAILEEHNFVATPRKRAGSDQPHYHRSTPSSGAYSIRINGIEEDLHSVQQSPRGSPRSMSLVNASPIRPLASPRLISPTKTDPNTRLKGVLYQLTTNQIRPWGKRLLYLTQDYLALFKSKDHKKPLATIECGSIYRVEQLPHWYKKKEFCMAIRTYGRSYIFSAESQKDLTMWITCIEASIRDCALDGVVYSFQHLLNSYDGDEMKFATVILERMQQQVPQWSNFSAFQTDVRRYLQYMQHQAKNDHTHDNDENILEEKVEPWQIDFGTLKLGKKIAEGYFGEVYKGTFLQKKVAIKRLKFTQVNDAQEQEKIIHKLKEEAAVMSSLRHPNILLFMGLCSRLPNICIVTEFADNGNLYDVLQNKVVDDRVFFRMIKDICYGMNYLHNKNVLHLDLKPLNLLVDDNLNVKVSDFGISQIMLQEEEKKNTGPTGYGTILYMAPELIYEPITFGFAADVFGFGVSLFELMYLREHPDTNFTIEDSIGYDLVREPVSKDRDPLMPPWWMETLNGLICECTLSDFTKRPDFEKILKILDTIVDDSEWFIIRHHANQIRRLAKTPMNRKRLLEYNVWETLNKIIDTYTDDVAIYYALCATIELSITTQENPAEYLILALDHLERLTYRTSRTPTNSQNSQLQESFEECLFKIGRVKYIDMLINSEHVVVKGKERVLKLIFKWIKHEGCANKMIKQKIIAVLAKLAQLPKFPSWTQIHFPVAQILQAIAGFMRNEQLHIFVEEGGVDTLVQLSTKSTSHNSLFTSLQALADLSVRDSKLALVIEGKGIKPVQMASRAFLPLKMDFDNEATVSPNSRNSLTRQSSPMGRSKRREIRNDELQPFMSLTFQRVKSQLEAQVTPKNATKQTGNSDDDEVVSKLWEILRDERDLSEVDTAQVRETMQQWFSTQMEERREIINSQIQKVVGQMEEPSQITECLYLGSEWNSANIRQLKRLHITNICNVGAECPNYYPNEFTYFNIKVSSSDIDVDIASQLETFFEFVEKTRNEHGVVLVHSHLGVSRSASYCIAYVMFKNNWSLQKAYKYVKDKRKIVKPSQECMRQLIQYDIKLFGQQSLGIHSHSNSGGFLRSLSNSSLSYEDVSYGSPDVDSMNILSSEVFNRMKEPKSNADSLPPLDITLVLPPKK